MKHSRKKQTHSSVVITEQDKAFIDNVLLYYKKYGRHDLLWRKNISAYRVLVSEIMLQQTQVSRVIPKFNQWLKTFPTRSRLGKASLKDVLILWQGLGYQRRAKALHSIAASTSKIPKDFYELLKLPGIGIYTASAISSFAYNTFSHPVLETNIRTALIETFHIHRHEINDETLYEDLRRLEKSALVQKMGARDWYYALMDYGAYLKSIRISHNQKTKGYTKQTPYRGSKRELRAKVLFAITKGEVLPDDTRLDEILNQLLEEKFISKKRGKYFIP